MDLEGDKALLKRFYEGRQMPSPNDGFLMPLGVRTTEDGTAALFLECSASSLRYRLEIPRATRTERKKVRDALAAGDDPACPRHGPDQRLARMGKELVCPLCGISFGKAK